MIYGIRFKNYVCKQMESPAPAEFYLLDYLFRPHLDIILKLSAQKGEVGRRNCCILEIFENLIQFSPCLVIKSFYNQTIEKRF